MDLLYCRGYGAVSVDDICDASKVKKGSFYHYFPSKEALVLEAIERNWEQRKPFLDALFSSSKEPLDRFIDYFAYVQKRQTELRVKYGKVVGCLYFSLGNECGYVPSIAACVQRVTATYVRYYENTIVDMQSRGQLDARPSAERARALFALVEGLLMSARINDDLKSLSGLQNIALGLLDVSPSRTKVSA